jgi:hypothetical protein
MKQSLLLSWLLLSLTISGVGQLNKVKDIEIPVLNAGTAKWPIKLTKQWFEEDTMYNLTFHDAGPNSTGKISRQGLFIFELKAFGEALQTALSIDSGCEIHFKDGTIEKTGSESNYGQILIRFASGTGSFITTEAIAIKLIHAIRKESSVRYNR